MASAAVPITERTAAEIGGVEGLRHLAQACRPIVIRGVCSDWPAMQMSVQSNDAVLAYLARFDSGSTAEYFAGPPNLCGRYHYGDGPGGFNFARETIAVRQAIARIAANAQDAGEIGYLGSLPTDHHFPGFAEANPCALLPPNVRPRIWLGNASTVACHYDTYDNLACAVAGRRRFTLYPPDAIGDLYAGPIDHTLSGQPISLATGAASDDPQYPRFAAARARAVMVELAPGDALYLPKLWWHQVEALDPVNILVNYWWDGFSAGPDAPHTAMLLAMIAIAERPAAERDAWRAYFDHYVFRPDGHPLAHMPDAQHGVLGPLGQGNYGRIRALVMRLLRGQ
ncbi:MAG: cupin-like domain-containing protein [Alphaproteobacteria bacterium]